MEDTKNCMSKSWSHKALKGTLWNKKISNRQPNFHIKGLEKEQMKPKVSRRKEIKNGVEMNKIEVNKRIKKINETKSWLFEMINKIDKPLVRLTKEKREGSNKISNDSNERGNITSGTTEVQRLIGEYCA